MDWGRIEAELTGKIRWAIATTVGENQVCNLSYQDGKNWAAMYASDVTEGLKLKEAKPDYSPWLTSTGSRI